MLKNSHKSICYFLNKFGLIWTQDMRNACLQTHKTKHYAKYGRGTYTLRTFSTKDLFLLSISVTLYAVQSSLTFLAPFKVMILSFNLFISKRFFSKIVYFLCSPSVPLDRVDVTYQRNQILH